MTHTDEIRSAAQPAEYPRYFADAELRVVEVPDKRPRIVGYAALWNTRSADLGGFKEEIAPGAFTEALASTDDVLALVEHNPGLIIGRRSAGTLSLSEDARGLRVEIDPPNTTVGNDLIENIRRGDIKGMSFRFPRGAKDSWRVDAGESIRTLHKVGLREVTCTAIPAYDKTSVSVRALNDAEESEMRTYYQAQIDALKKPEATPSRNLAEKRLRFLGVEKRAVVEVESDQVIYTCRYGIEQCRAAFDQLNRVIDVVAQTSGTLTDADRTAASDCISAIIDLQAKAKAARAALQSMGAADNATEAA